jgi:hypothetical protein
MPSGRIHQNRLKMNRKIVNGMRPNLLAHYLYLWELTAVRQAVETAWISTSVRRTFIELLVPAGSSSSLGQARGRSSRADLVVGAIVQSVTNANSPQSHQ